MGCSDSFVESTNNKQSRGNGHESCRITTCINLLVSQRRTDFSYFMLFNVTSISEYGGLGGQVAKEVLLL